MDRAEEVIHSQMVSDKANDYCSLYYDWDNKAERRAVTETFKQGYYEGYLQAEKDLALTLEDIEKIDDLIHTIPVERPRISTKDAYEEVLRRFNEQRNGDH